MRATRSEAVRLMLVLAVVGLLGGSWIMYLEAKEAPKRAAEERAAAERVIVARADSAAHADSIISGKLRSLTYEDSRWLMNYRYEERQKEEARKYKEDPERYRQITKEINAMVEYKEKLRRQ